MSEQKKQALAEVERLAHEVASGLGLEVVEFVFHGQGRHSQLRIDIDRPGASGVGIADCERLSRALDARLEEVAALDSAYELQVSSPGIDRPIRSDGDIRRNTGRLVHVAFRDETAKVREISGILAGLEGTAAVRLATEKGDVTITRDVIVLMKQDVSTGGRKRNER
jgi:ribosome maturation factor RimP